MHSSLRFMLYVISKFWGMRDLRLGITGILLYRAATNQKRHHCRHNSPQWCLGE